MATGRLRFEVLGSLRIRRDDADVEVTAGTQRKVLAALLSRPGRPVSVAELIDGLWPDAPPGNAPRNVRGYVSKLKRAMGEPAELTSSGSSYALMLAREQFDVHQFVGGIKRAQATGDPASAVEMLDRALALWRGTPYDGLGDWGMLQPEIESLNRWYLEGLEHRAELGLQLGRQIELVPELTRQVADQPYAERLAGHLMLALYRSGRQAEALDVFTRTRRRLVDELGIEPRDELAGLYQAILERDPGLELPSSGGGRSMVRPAQLPPDAIVLTGRDTEMDEIHALATAYRPAVVSVEGMAGIGKTALVVRLAHQLAAGYPDGQLFIDLHGYTRGVKAVDPILALGRLLRADGLPASQVPDDLEECAALWRSRTAGRRLLIVLDNAASERQVEPLLPSSAGCLVLITSRRRLQDLDQVRSLTLDPIPAGAAVAMFTTIAGAGRMSGALTSELVELCGRLPLAIRIVAAKLRSRPGWDLAELVGRLRDEHELLAQLGSGERSVPGAFRLSYDGLSPQSKLVFRRLGLHPGTDFDRFAVAALAELEPAAAEQAMEDLVDAHLLQSPQFGRYTFHDLLRLQAAQMAEQDSRIDRRAVFSRLFDYYLRAASVAMNFLEPATRHQRPQFTDSAVRLPVFDDRAHANRWLDTERGNLLAVALTGGDERAEQVARLSTCVFRYLHSGCHTEEALRLHEAHVRAAQAAGDRVEEAFGLSHVAATYYRLAQYEQAIHALLEAVECLADQDDQACRARVANLLGAAYSRVGQLDRAMPHLREAVTLERQLGDLSGVAQALVSLGTLACVRYDFDEATRLMRQAVTLARSVDNRRVEASALHGLAFAAEAEGRYDDALESVDAAIRLAKEAGHRPGEAAGLCLAAVVLRQLGRLDEALERGKAGLAIARAIGDRNYEVDAFLAIGGTLRMAGATDAAIEHLGQALRLARELHQTADEAMANYLLGLAFRDRGDLADAGQHLRRSLELYRGLGLPAADVVRGRLDELLRH